MKSAAKKLERARSVASGAGFLLRKLKIQFGHEFSVGMNEQVNQAINDCQQQGRALNGMMEAKIREVAKASERGEK